MRNLTPRPAAPDAEAEPPCRAHTLVRVFLLIAFTVTGVFAHSQELETRAREELHIESSGGSHRFLVENAVTQAQRERGLMFRSDVAQGTGMLFVNEVDRPVAMWMKNTLVSLDMLFLGSDGTVVKIHPNAEPLSTRLISSDVPVRAVLEIPGGTTQRLGIVPGDRVIHPAFEAPGTTRHPAR